MIEQIFKLFVLKQLTQIVSTLQRYEIEILRTRQNVIRDVLFVVRTCASRMWRENRMYHLHIVAKTIILFLFPKSPINSSNNLIYVIRMKQFDSFVSFVGVTNLIF